MIRREILSPPSAGFSIKQKTIMYKTFGFSEEQVMMRDGWLGRGRYLYTRGAGYMRGDMSRLWLDARQGTIGAGSSEIMRNVIARIVLS